MSSATERQVRALAAAAGHRSLRALALAAGIDRGSLARTLAEGRRPKPQTIDRLARALGCAPDLVARIFDTNHAAVRP
jgi:DNA-binding phage protein